MKPTWRRYKDVLVHPHSELEKLLAAGENKKAEELYNKVSKEAIERGEFRLPGRTLEGCGYLATSFCNKCGRDHSKGKIP